LPDNLVENGNSGIPTLGRRGNRAPKKRTTAWGKRRPEEIDDASTREQRTDGSHIQHRRQQISRSHRRHIRFCASATLIEKHERDRKERASLPGKRRGQQAAARWTRRGEGGGLPS